MVEAMIKGDTQVQHDVLRELEWDARVEAARIGVAVEDRLVTLTGAVPSYAQRLVAQEAAHRVRGVRDVVNHLTVTIPGTEERTDAALAQAVRQALEWDPSLPHEGIRTSVTEGWVTLEGVVDRRSQREDAEHLIRHVAGVQGVLNRVMVRAQETDPHKVRALIEEALERQAIRAAAHKAAHAATCIGVTVEGGTVTLSGVVCSWAEKQAVLGAAGHAPGVREVVDAVRVDPIL